MLRKDIEILMDTGIQPLWYKILKSILLVSSFIITWLLVGYLWVIVIFVPLVISGILVHISYRVKTKGFSTEWAGLKPVGEGDRRIGFQYYVMIFSGWIGFSIIFYLLLM
ncbi:MAG: hypothetical protein INQ03_17700 [Candidatus Heimdallarchaeota archaeon]|nr:hypothetical protein [Candidatus Heimdallarchaeota archaeon]